MQTNKGGQLFGKSENPTKTTSAGTERFMQTKIGLKKQKKKTKGGLKNEKNLSIIYRSCTYRNCFIQ
jgi:hypothetical protein